MVRASRDLVGKGGIYTASTAVGTASTLVTLPLVTRCLSLGEFGTVALCVTVAQLLGLVVHFALPTAITRAYFLEDGGEQVAGRLVFNGGVISAVTTVSVAATAALWWPLAADGPWFPNAVLTALYGGLLAGVNLSLAYLRALERAWVFVATSLMSTVGGVSMGLTLAVVISPTATTYIFGLTCMQVVALTAARLKRGRRAARPSSPYLKRALSIAIPTIPHLFALQGFLVGLRLIAQTIHGVETVGRFHVAYTAGSVAIVLVSAMNNAWAPIVFRAPASERLEVLAETTKFMLTIAGAVSGAAALASPGVLLLLAPSTYDVNNLVPTVAIVATSGPLYVLYLASMHVVAAEGRTGWLAVTTPCAALLALCVPLVLDIWRPINVASLALSVPTFFALVAIATEGIARGTVAYRGLWARAMAIVAAIGLVGWLAAVIRGAPFGPTISLSLAGIASLILLNAVWRAFIASDADLSR